MAMERVVTGWSLGSVLETKDKLVGPRITELPPDHFLHVGRIGTEPLQNFFLILQAEFGFGHPSPAFGLNRGQPGVFLSRFNEKNAGRHADSADQHKIEGDDTTA